MLSYERLLSYGNIIQLGLKCDVSRMMNEISAFTFRPYNRFKPQNPRTGLSITSLDGSLQGDDLESLYEIAAYNNQQPLSEMDFKIPTDVYHASQEVRKIVNPFKRFLGRTHFLNFKTGGFFPPHRDDRGAAEQETFRIIVPLIDCAAPHFYYIFDEEIVNLRHGYAYFMNTNLQHAAFSFSNSVTMMVMNIEACPESYQIVIDNIFKK